MQYHYGPSPMCGGNWLDTPLRIVEVYAQMLPRLQAEEALRWADIVAIPHVTQQSRRQLMNQWRSAAAGNSTGPRELRNAADVRRWFTQAGYRI